MDELLQPEFGSVAAWALALVAIGVAVYVSPMVVRRAAEARLAALCRTRHALVLTYDDGPGEVLTPRVLALLRERNVKATFYSLGRRAVAAPTVLDRVADEGHEVGSHSFHHVNALRSAPWTAFLDVRRGFATHARWIASRPAFRPPHGKVTIVTWALLHLRHAQIGWWTVDSGDTWSELPDAASVVTRVRTGGGGVVLMHDFDRSGQGADERAAFVLAATRRLLDLAEEDGLRVLSMAELLRDPVRAQGAT